MKTQIREKHFKEIYQIDKASFKYHYNEKQLKDVLDYYDRLVEKSEGKIVAFLLYKIEKEEIFIRRIAVLPQFRKKNIGRNMVQEVIKKAKARNLKKVYAFSRISNKQGVKFFTKLGFNISRKVEKYYPPNNETAYILEKQV